MFDINKLLTKELKIAEEIDEIDEDLDMDIRNEMIQEIYEKYECKDCEYGFDPCPIHDIEE